MSIINYLKENLEHFDWVYGDDISPDDADVADTIAKDGGINILRDKELNTVVKEISTGEVVGALWTAWDNNEFSFDVATDIVYGGMGIGSKLVDNAIAEFNNDSDAFEDPIMVIDVVSHIMESILKKRGFKLQKQIAGHKIYIKK